DGRVKFEHGDGTAGDSSWLIFNKCPETIMGLRATIVVESWDGAVRARIGANVGVLRENPDHIVWYQMALRHTWASWREPPVWYDRLQGNANVNDISEGWKWLYDNIYTELGTGKYPTVVGIPYTITAEFDRKKASFEFNDPADLGKVKYKYGEEIRAFEPFRGIGTRSTDNEGSCVAYFDDVYVLREGDCDIQKPTVVSSIPADGEKKVSVNLSEISIKFNETMRGYAYSWDSPWSDPDTTFEFPKTFIQESLSVEQLEYATWYTVTIDKGGFYDLADNPNKPYSFSFKTEKQPE
ncbi:Ig-like domain-containing protein, partial [bacterium]|nr:Ig-like domain-containing protein [bacterium]